MIPEKYSGNPLRKIGGLQFFHRNIGQKSEKAGFTYLDL